MNPDLRVGADLGRQAAQRARVFAVDEDVHVAAELALFVEHPVADAGMLARESFYNFRNGDARIVLERQGDYIAAAGPFA